MSHPLIGPHEGKEFELIDQGLKHVALFCEIIPDLYHSFTQRPDFGCIEWEVACEGHTIPYRVLHRQSHKQAAQRLAELVQNVQGWQDEKEREIGRILGYPQEAIDYFVNTRPERMAAIAALIEQERKS